MKTKIYTCLLAATLTLSGCAETGLSIAANVIGSTVGNALAYGKYASVGQSWKIRDTDFRELDPNQYPKLADYIRLAKDGQAVQILPEVSAFKAFTIEDFKAYRQQNRAGTIRPDGSAEDMYILASLDMKKTSDLEDIGHQAFEKKAIVMVRGLKNDSIEESMSAAKFITDQGAVVLIAPAVMEILKARFSPTFATVQIKADGSIGCTPSAGKKTCPAYGGTTGFLRPVFVIGGKS
ncbi:hypothetical protein GJV52_12575 [Neisseria brasiliensis]|uniref:hypothetical protein n=1 Tax=Neisseria TaxID=482 RepID=UPI000C27AB62|nr:MULTISPECIES: hypothetical protein [Neisseria]PJO79153.1 hypothetical protein CWC45_01580 [Neisseria sp. N177_16]QGL26288.1 hypothetical protein GJV52_12575 [Neisseria brasiliensis]